jgi:hypothetical protein
LESVRLQIGKPGSINLSDVHPEWHGEYAAPFGYRPNHLGTDLTSRIDYGFYEGLENANTPAAVRRKISDLAREPQRALLLPEHFDDSCLVNASGEKHLISFLFVFHYRARAIHTDSVYRPLCDYIHARYKMEDERTPTKDGYRVWITTMSDKSRESTQELSTKVSGS